MLYVQAPTPEIPKLPADTPGWVQAVVYAAVAVIAAVGLASRYIGSRDAKPAPAPPATPPPTGTLPAAAPAGSVQAEAGKVPDLLDRLADVLEKQLDQAIATQHEIQRRYDEEVDELRAQLAAVQHDLSVAHQEKWQLSGRMQDLQRQLDDARNEVVRLRAELSARYPGRSW